MLRLGLVALTLAATSSEMAAASDNDYKAEAAIRACASVVRSQGHTWFNAVYNRSSKTVETNVQSEEQEKAISPFEKCLTAQGVFTQLSR